MSVISRRQAFSALSAAALTIGGSAARSEPVNDGTWSAHPLWPVLKKTKLKTDAAGGVRAAFAPEVVALVNKPMAISGFILPIEATSRYRHFVLSRYSPECPFCPAGGPNEVIEIFSNGAVGPTPAMVTLKGVFTIQDDMARGMFYRLEHAAMA